MGTGIDAPAAAGSSAEAKINKLPIRRNTLRDVVENPLLALLFKCFSSRTCYSRHSRCRGLFMAPRDSSSPTSAERSATREEKENRNQQVEPERKPRDHRFTIRQNCSPINLDYQARKEPRFTTEGNVHHSSSFSFFFTPFGFSPLVLGKKSNTFAKGLNGGTACWDCWENWAPRSSHLENCASTELL